MNITHQIYNLVFSLLDQHSKGLHWSELLSTIKKSHPEFHPKTINGCIWKLVEKYPDKVYKPSRGLFQLLKYKSK